jgi:XRE family transcriptional regulator, regulator of sulfur utilization
MCRVELGRVLRQARDTQGWTQERLAAASGLTRDKIAKIERGSMRCSAWDFIRLARALHRSLDSLVAEALAEQSGRETRGAHGQTTPTCV